MEKNTLKCLIMATLLEAQPFIEGLSLTKQTEERIPVYRNDNYILAISGIGKTNSAIACAYSCLKFSPSCIVNLGAAGATGSTISLGMNFHIVRAIEYDRPRFKSKNAYTHTPDFFEGFSSARIATLDRPVLDPSERQRLSLIADLVDMESASVIQTCKKFKTKCYLFKYVSDTADHIKDKDIVDNIKIYRDSFFKFFFESVTPLF
ncbi:MAG: hypothetical protein ACLPVO_14925 [Desulfomonilaceae bacterium]